MNIFKKENGDLSLTKIMAAISFCFVLICGIVELLTSLDFKHFNEFCIYSSGLVALAVGSKAVDIKGGR